MLVNCAGLLFSSVRSEFVLLYSCPVSLFSMPNFISLAYFSAFKVSSIDKQVSMMKAIIMLTKIRFASTMKLMKYIRIAKSFSQSKSSSYIQTIPSQSFCHMIPKSVFKAITQSLKFRYSQLDSYSNSGYFSTNLFNAS